MPAPTHHCSQDPTDYTRQSANSISSILRAGPGVEAGGGSRYGPQWVGVGAGEIDKDSASSQELLEEEANLSIQAALAPLPTSQRGHLSPQLAQTLGLLTSLSPPLSRLPL